MFLGDEDGSLQLVAESAAGGVGDGTAMHWPARIAPADLGVEHDSDTFGALQPEGLALLEGAQLDALPFATMLREGLAPTFPLHCCLVPLRWSGRLCGVLAIACVGRAAFDRNVLSNLLPMVALLSFAVCSGSASRAAAAGDERLATEERLVQTHHHICAGTLALLNGTRSLPEFLKEGLASLVSALSGIGGSAWLLDAERQRIRKFMELGGSNADHCQPCGPDHECAACVAIPFPAEGPWHTPRTVLLSEVQVEGVDVQALADQGVQSLLVLPLKSELQTIGWLSVRFARDARAEGLHDNSSIDAITRMLALAVELDHLVKNVRSASMAAERRRLAREMHDTVAQDAASLLILLRSAVHMGETGRGDYLVLMRNSIHLVRKILDDTREGLVTLRARGQEYTGFLQALKRMLADHPGKPQIYTPLEIQGQLPVLDADMELELLRIAREAFNNARRHAGAKKFAVSVQARSGELEIDFVDDGRGFDPDSPTDGWGLIGMRERAERLGATLTLDSARGRGTAIRLIVPLKPQRPGEDTTWARRLAAQLPPDQA